MADIKISGLATSATSIGGYIPIVIGGDTKKVLVASVFDYISTNDGNGGQPPAPKPIISGGTVADPGWARQWTGANNTDVTLPYNGSWRVLAQYYCDDSAPYTLFAASLNNDINAVYAGGTIILPAVSGKRGIAFIERIIA